MPRNKKKKSEKGQTTLNKYIPVGYTILPDDKQNKQGNKKKNENSSSSNSKQESVQPSLEGATTQVNDTSVQERPGPSVSNEAHSNLKDDEVKAQEASVNFHDKWDNGISESVPCRPDQIQHNEAQISQETDTVESQECWDNQETYNQRKNYNTQVSNSEKSHGRGRMQNKRDPKDDNITESKQYSRNQDASNNRFMLHKPWERTNNSGSHRMQTRGGQKRDDSNVESERYLENQNRPKRSGSSYKNDDGGFSRDSRSRIDDTNSERNGNQNTSKQQYDPWSDSTTECEGNNTSVDWNNTENSDTFDADDKKLTKNECDEEFYKFCKHKIQEFQKVEEEQGDLFAQPLDYCLAHCVAEDMNMGSGIAVTFRQMFKRVDVLLNQGQRTGGLAVLPDKDRYIYYLVTKKQSSGKPTLRSLFASLLKMRQHIEQNKVKKLAMPRIGCGLDRLEWSDVKPMLEYIFRNVDIKIVVCNFQQNYGKTKPKLQQKTEPKNSKQSGKKPNKNKKHKK